MPDNINKQNNEMDINCKDDIGIEFDNENINTNISGNESVDMDISNNIVFNNYKLIDIIKNNIRLLLFISSSFIILISIILIFVYFNKENSNNQIKNIAENNNLSKEEIELMIRDKMQEYSTAERKKLLEYTKNTSNRGTTINAVEKALSKKKEIYMFLKDKKEIFDDNEYIEIEKEIILEISLSKELNSLFKEIVTKEKISDIYKKHLKVFDE